MLTYCFESAYVARTLAKCRKNDLAAVDTEGHELSVKNAVSRGVHVYGYLNVGAVESGRSYYSKFKSIRLAPYDGWDGEYWIDPTDRAWQDHCVSLAKQIKATGAIGLYLDNTDIYYMIAEKKSAKPYSVRREVNNGIYHNRHYANYHIQFQSCLPVRLPHLHSYYQMQWANPHRENPRRCRDWHRLRIVDTVAGRNAFSRNKSSQNDVQLGDIYWINLETKNNILTKQVSANEETTWKPRLLKLSLVQVRASLHNQDTAMTMDK